ncbi:MAG: hypothetical protein JO211_17160, partial [Acidobacteriaceae bacterium]|nr:hypothetical protein [Acidobacteriaceae bacterium]
SFENSLYIAIKKLRQLLGDEADVPRYIETIPKRGYRFIAAVNVADSGETVEKLEPQPAEERAPDSALAGRSNFFPKIRRYLYVIAIAILAIATVSVIALMAGKSQTRSLAVLPFRNLSQDPSEEYLADGMTDQVITELAESTSLRVISLTSVMKFKSTAKSLPEIARELNADLVVEGSIARVRGRARIIAQLLDARKDRHLWGRAYEKNEPDVLRFQDDVARDIATEIASRLPYRSDELPSRRRPANSEAYDSYLRGRYLWNRRTRDDLARSIDYFQRAVQLDPSYAEAFAAMGEAYIVSNSFGGNPATTLQLAQQAAEKALQLDGRLAPAHTTLAAIHVARLEWDPATTEYQLALKYNPNYATAHHWYGIHLARLGKYRQAATEMQRALYLDPLSLIIETDAGESRYWSGDNKSAETYTRRALELDQNFAQAHIVMGKIYEQKKQFQEALGEFRVAEKLFGRAPEVLCMEGHALALSGDRTQALSIAQELERTAEHQYVSGVDVGMVYCALGDRDAAMRWLDKAFERHDNGIDILRAEPLFDGCRNDLRFLHLLQSLRLL